MLVCPPGFLFCHLINRRWVDWVDGEISLANDVSRVLEFAAREAPPVNVGRIAELMGARVFAAEFNSPDRISSRVKTRNGEIDIYVRDSLSPEWKRFAAATELARVPLESSNDGNGEPPETEVSRLARDLLMPRHLVLSIWPLMNDKYKLALAFYVPKAVMEARIADLGL